MDLGQERSIMGHAQFPVLDFHGGVSVHKNRERDGLTPGNEKSADMNKSIHPESCEFSTGISQ